MSASRVYDAIVVGAGAGGLTAAAYLARVCQRVLVLDAAERPGAPAGMLPLGDGAQLSLLAPVLHALDARAVHELALGRDGLSLVQHDVRLAGLRHNGRHFVLTRHALAERGTAAALRARDISAYGRFTATAYAFARKLRPLWLDGEGEIRPDELDPCAAAARVCGLKPLAAERLRALYHMSAAGWLEHWFDSDALKAVLGFDAIADSRAPDEPGSALMLVWRFAQSFHAQGVTVQVRGGAGALVAALESAARRAGAELRTGARVVAILAENGRAGGVVLTGGEELRAPMVFSTLDARRTLLELTPPAAVGFGTAASIPEYDAIGCARIALLLAGPPPFVGLSPSDLRARLVVAARPESAAEAQAAALAGTLAADPVMEIAVPTAADPALAPGRRHILVVSVPFTPVAPRAGWDTERGNLKKQIVTALDNFAPGLKGRIIDIRMVTPADTTPRLRENPVARLLAPYGARVATPIDGLYLCGGSAEPASAISGRAGRIVARQALATMKERAR
jgi:phytoene dehydrogenase-like protein